MKHRTPINGEFWTQEGSFTPPPTFMEKAHLSLKKKKRGGRSINVPNTKDRHFQELQGRHFNSECVWRCNRCNQTCTKILNQLQNPLAVAIRWCTWSWRCCHTKVACLCSGRTSPACADAWGPRGVVLRHSSSGLCCKSGHEMMTVYSRLTSFFFCVWCKLKWLTWHVMSSTRYGLNSFWHFLQYCLK